MPAVITGRDSTARYSAMRGPSARRTSSGSDSDSLSDLDCSLPLYLAYIATANSIEPLPAPLKDRFRIVKVPAPRRRDHGEAGAVGLSRMPVARNRRVTMVPYGHDRE
jgi:hypothetical protein